MKLVGNGQRIVGDGQRISFKECFNVWELPPARRTIVGLTRGLTPKTFFVPFPYTYLIVGSKQLSISFIGTFLAIGFRPSSPQPGNNDIFMFDMDNTFDGVVCLGEWDNKQIFTTEKQVAESMAEAYFSSPFTSIRIDVPLKNKKRFCTSPREHLTTSNDGPPIKTSMKSPQIGKQ